MLITGYLTAPNSTDGRKLPLILLPHGGPIGIRDNWSFDADARSFLANRGYAVLQVNFRGSSGRGTAFQMAGARGFSGVMIDDLIDGLKWASTQPVSMQKKLRVWCELWRLRCNDGANQGSKPRQMCGWLCWSV